jgi:hypothetical protein
MEMHLEGVSTRTVKDITEELCGNSLSKSLVSMLVGKLDSELETGGIDRWKSKATFTSLWRELPFPDHHTAYAGISSLSASLVLVLPARGCLFGQ